MRRAQSATGDRLPALTSVSALLYALAALALTVAWIWYSPGKNPRWVLGTLALVAAGLTATALARGRRFTTTEATVFLALYLGCIVSLTHTTGVDLAAFSNGLALPLLGIYTSWLLPRRGSIVFYAGLVGWVAAVAARSDQLLATMALVVAGEAVVMTEIVRVLVVRITRLMYSDALTQTLNRAGTTRRTLDLIAASRRRGTPLAAAVIDIDGLREVNNRAGHRAGDELLARAAREWVATLHDGESVGRIGGDEFVILVPGATRETATRRLSALQAQASVAWTWGVAEAVPGDTPTSLFERADLEMFERKAARRDEESAGD